jgi:tetratricopeptide (TPR) repeat protein
LKFISLLMRPLFVLAVLLTSACASSWLGNPDSAPLEEQALEVNPALQQTDPLADAAYDLVVAEIALNQGDTALAIERYLALSRSQQNPAIAERAVRIAVYGQDLEAAIEAAQRWIELEPERIEARQVIAAIYIRQDKADDALVYIDDLIENSELGDEELFPPLIGILAREKNIDTVLEVSEGIARNYPERAYAQYLHGMLSAHCRRLTGCTRLAQECCCVSAGQAKRLSVCRRQWKAIRPIRICA